jgi:hypothetical protein
MIQADATNPKIAERGKRRVAMGCVGYAEITASSASFTALTIITGLEVTFTAQANRRYRFTFSGEVTQSDASGVWVLSLEDTVSTLKRITSCNNTTSSVSVEAAYVNDVSLTGSKTWRLNGVRAGGAGTITISAAAAYPAYVMVEDIGAL